MTLTISDRVSLLLLVKYPSKGRVKTRLASRIGEENAVLLYRDFVQICFQNICRLKQLDCTIYFDPSEEEDAFRAWLGHSSTCMKPPDFLPQPDGDFGQRIRYGIENRLQTYSSVIVLGTDSPDLPLDYIEQAARYLQNIDVVVGPADDGGYYLIGLSRPAPLIFENISWSTEKVFMETISAIRDLSLTCHILPPWYDVDTLDDLRRLLHSSNPSLVEPISQWEKLLDGRLDTSSTDS